jgi:hypothetical protein
MKNLAIYRFLKNSAITFICLGIPWLGTYAGGKTWDTAWIFVLLIIVNASVGSIILINTRRTSIYYLLYSLDILFLCLANLDVSIRITKNNLDQPDLISIFIVVLIWAIFVYFTMIDQRAKALRGHRFMVQSGIFQPETGEWNLSVPFSIGNPEDEKEDTKKWLALRRLSPLFVALGFMISRSFSTDFIQLIIGLLEYMMALTFGWISGRAMGLIGAVYIWEKELGKRITIKD